MSVFKLTIACALLFCVNADASITMDCVATEVYGGPLEESFSVEEYPDVSVSEGEVWIGASLFSAADGDSIELSESDTHLKAKITLSSGDDSFEIRVNKTSKKGVVDYFTDNIDETGRIAALICK